MRESHFRLFAVLTVVVLGVLAYAGTFGNGWVWDDASSVLVHQNVQNPAQFLQLFREDQDAFGRGAGNFYRPLVSAGFMADFWLSHDPALDASPKEVKPTLFHAVNLAWHVAAALLLMALLLRLKAPRFVVFAVPAIFVVHPLHTEAVAYISGRADMMSAAFMFAGLWFALGEGKGRARIVSLVFSAVCVALALLSKESSLIFPVLLAVLLLLRPWEGSAPWPRRLLPLAAPVAVVAVYGVLRATVLKFAENSTAASSLGQRLFETGQAFTFYLEKLFWPVNLHMEQSLAGYASWRAYLGWALIMLFVLAVAGALRFGHRRIAMGLAWFIAAWLPISGLFPLNAPMAEHWMYVPMAGFWWAVVEGILLMGHGPVTRRARVAVVYGACVVFLVLTVARDRDWRDNETLFHATLADNPASERVHFNLAVSYEDITKNNAGARREYEWLLRRYAEGRKASSVSGQDYLLPNEDEVLLSLARVLIRQGDYGVALTHLGRLLTLTESESFDGPRGEAARRRVILGALAAGRCFLALGDLGQAGAAFNRAVQLDPSVAPRVQGLMRGSLSLRDS